MANAKAKGKGEFVQPSRCTQGCTQAPQPQPHGALSCIFLIAVQSAHKAVHNTLKKKKCADLEDGCKRLYFLIAVQSSSCASDCAPSPPSPWRRRGTIIFQNASSYGTIIFQSSHLWAPHFAKVPKFLWLQGCGGGWQIPCYFKKINPFVTRGTEYQGHSYSNG